MHKGEDNLIAWIAERFSEARGQPSRDDDSAESPGRERIPIGIGDDMAMLPAASGRILITADMLMDGVHFDSSTHAPEQIGRKALAASLSDCAAMAVRPRWAVVSVALPEAWSMCQAQALFLGMTPVAEKYGCRIVGGDTNSWKGPLVVDVALVAEPHRGIEPVRRDGLQIGDEVLVTGRLGGSLSGHHLTFEPRLNEARALAEALGSSLHAMMDISDGLSVDAARMASKSGSGILLDETALPAVVSDAAKAMSAADGRSPIEHALNDGEDFELLFGVEAGAMEAVALSIMRLVTRVGEAVEEPGLWMVSSDGARAKIEPGGWRHFR